MIHVLCSVVPQRPYYLFTEYTPNPRQLSYQFQSVGYRKDREQEKMSVCRATYTMTANVMQRLLNNSTETIIHSYAKKK